MIFRLIRKIHMFDKPGFPIKITFENGEIDFYQDIEDLEINLEDFDSEVDRTCIVEDANGRLLRLKISLLNLEELEFI